MSHFLTTISGRSNPKSIAGTKGSGMQVHARGWDMGIKVFLTHNEDLDRDEAEIYLTTGSNNDRVVCHIGTYAKERRLPDNESKPKSDPRLRIGEARRVEA